MKLFAADLDGTLLNSNHEISKNDAEALKKLTDDGVELVFASGRYYDNVKKLMEKNNLQGHIIALNGAQVVDKGGNIISEEYLRFNEVKNVIEFCNENDIMYMIYTSDNVYIKLIKNLITELYDITKKYSMQRKKLENADDILKEIQRFYTLFYKHPLYDENIDEKFKEGLLRPLKLELTCANDERLQKVREIASLNSNLEVTSANSFNLEITLKNVDKGCAITKLSNYLNVTIEEVVSIGDSYNDIEMFKCSGTSIAMENSVDNLKEISDFVTKSNDECGVAYAIEHLLKSNELEEAQ